MAQILKDVVKMLSVLESGTTKAPFTVFRESKIE